MKNYYTYLFILCLMFPIRGVSQTQIGSDIYGDQAGQAANGVALNEDGTIAIVGSTGNSFGGKTQVYQLNGNTWTQIGQDIFGEADGDQASGGTYAISDDGTIIAIGAKRNDGNGPESGHVRVFQLSNNVWTQLGSDIDGEAANDQSGWSIALNSSGTILAVGAPWHQNTRGHVKVYEFINNNWMQIGADIDGASSGDLCGYSVALSADGSKVAVGAILHFNIDTGNAGHVRVFEYSNNSWTQLGDEMVGEAQGDSFGDSIAMSNDGSVVAIGADSNDGNGSSAGHVRVFELIINSWTQIGQDIDGEAAGDKSGGSIALSGNGNVLAVGAGLNDDGGIDAGHTRVFEFVNMDWVQVGTDIDGAADNDFEGTVSISDSGLIIGTGAPGNDGNGDGSGRVRIFDISELLGINSFPNELNISIYPNPTSDHINIKGTNAKLNLVIINSLGQEIISKVILNKMDISWLESGLYFVKLTDGIRTSIHKIIKD